MLAALDRRHRFAYSDTAAIAACVAELGYAVVEDVLDDDLVAELRADIARAIDIAAIAPGGNRYHVSFVEESPGQWRLLGDRRYIDLNRALTGSAELTIHRSAAIVRLPGAPGQGWHNDRPEYTGEPSNSGEVLNRWDDFPAGMWFYLGGSAPDRGGLAVIAGSHRPGWPGPRALAAADPRWSSVVAGDCPVRSDLPGMIPVVSGPRDLAIFAARTWHAALPHPGAEPRLACAVALRPRRIRVDAPWPLPDHAREFIARAPAHVRALCEGYVGIDPGWRR